MKPNEFFSYIYYNFIYGGLGAMHVDNPWLMYAKWQPHDLYVSSGSTQKYKKIQLEQHDTQSFH